MRNLLPPPLSPTHTLQHLVGQEGDSLSQNNISQRAGVGPGGSSLPSPGLPMSGLKWSLPLLPSSMIPSLIKHQSPCLSVESCLPSALPLSPLDKPLVKPADGGRCK